MTHESRVYKSTLIARPNRFLGIVEFEGERIEVFIPNPGRMYELMIPGKEVYIREVTKSRNRRTKFDLIGVRHEGLLISIDSLLPNRFMNGMLQAQGFAPFKGFTKVKAEPALYDGRFDFLLENTTDKAYIEVKSCTLVVDGHARFPDAPTTRGARHIRSLARALQEGLADRAAVMFVIQRPDAILFSPNDVTDPTFGDALREGHDDGVEIYALSCEVRDWSLNLKETIPIDLEYFKR